MADHTITVTNSVRCFGAGPASLWNASYATWGSFKWGEGTADIPHAIVHLVSVSLSSTDTPHKLVTHLITETVTPSGMEIFRILPLKLISESISPDSEMTSEEVLDGSGYNRVFQGGVTDAENRTTTSWTDATDDTQTWSTATAATTTWSDA